MTPCSATHWGHLLGATLAAPPLGHPWHPPAPTRCYPRTPPGKTPGVTKLWTPLGPSLCSPSAPSWPPWEPPHRATALGTPEHPLGPFVHPLPHHLLDPSESTPLGPSWRAPERPLCPLPPYGSHPRAPSLGPPCTRRPSPGPPLCLLSLPPLESPLWATWAHSGPPKGLPCAAPWALLGAHHGAPHLGRPWVPRNPGPHSCPPGPLSAFPEHTNLGPPLALHFAPLGPTFLSPGTPRAPTFKNTLGLLSPPGSQHSEPPRTPSFGTPWAHHDTPCSPIGLP